MITIDDLIIKREKGRRTVSIRVENDALVCYAPYNAQKSDIEEILSHHQRALTNMLERVEKQKSLRDVPKFTQNDVQKLADEALKVIPPLVAKFAKLMGVTYGRITIRNQKTKWGSCSSKGNLNFNCYIMLFEKSEIEYLVVHELAHRKEMNHSKQFWNEVEKILPDYKERMKRIKEKEPEIMARRADIY